MISTDQAKKIKYVFTDIDGTLTTNSRIEPAAYQALWSLFQSGISVIPITGRPAGWCDLIARFWPVDGVIGENGALMYRYQNQKMIRFEFVDRETHKHHRKQLQQIANEVRREIPKAKISADQFCRRFDLAIDFAEDVYPELDEASVSKIKSIFERHGAHAKISNIHVNGWFGDYDKLSACRWYCQNWLDFDLNQNQEQICYVGDSPNDEPMFEGFQNSFGVANIRRYLPQLKTQPQWITQKSEGDGFLELAHHLIQSRNTKNINPAKSN